MLRTAIILGELMVAPARTAMAAQLIPLPEVARDPIEGNTVGVIPVWLITNSSQEVTAIFAPDVVYNELEGAGATFRYFGYPSDREQYWLTSFNTVRVDRDLDFGYERVHPLGLPLTLRSGLTFSRYTFYRYYGLGNDTRESDQSNYTRSLLEFGGTLEVSLGKASTNPLAGGAVLVVGERFRRMRIGTGRVPGLPFTGDAFPNAPGLDGATTIIHRVGLQYDSRDSRDVPTRGTYAAQFLDFSATSLGSSHSYERLSFDVRQFIPWGGGRFVLTARGLSSVRFGGDDVPFYERESIGGFDTLRSFGRDRFIDNGRVVLGSELRIRVIRTFLFGSWVDLEVAPFVEGGQVFHDSSDLRFSRFHPGGGIALRGLSRPRVVGHVDLGLGEEGLQIFVGIDYPY